MASPCSIYRPSNGGCLYGSVPESMVVGVSMCKCPGGGDVQAAIGGGAGGLSAGNASKGMRGM